MSSASLVVPLALWNQIPNTQVTCAAFKVGHLVTGLKTGQIWIYRCRVKGERGEVELEPKVLCIGHKSTVAALTIIEGYTDGSAGNDYVIISASDDGEVMKWCLLDGRCLVCVSRAFNGFPRSLKPLASSGQTAKYVLCCGFSNEITIMDSTTLEVVRIWAGHNDWVACTPFYDSDARQILLLTANFNGKLRIWTFDEQKKTIIKEHDNVGELDAHGDKILELTSNPYDIGVILSISRKCAIIFTIRRDKVLNVQGIVSPHSNVIWTGGMFLSKTRVLLWTKTGEAYLYLLPINSERKIQPELGNLMLRAGPTSPVRRSSLPLIPTTENLSSSSAKPLLLESVHRNDNDSEIHSAITTVFSPTNLEENTNIWYLISFRNRPSGTAYAWKSLPTTHILHAGDKGNSEAKWSQERNLASIWPLETLRNHLNQNTSQVTITTNVYDDQIAMGYENGEIRLVPIYLALTQNVQILNFPDIQLLIGHVGRVTCIYSPNMNTFGKKYLLSGGADCSVRIWSFENGKRLAVFTVHSQPVKKFLEPPSDVGVRIRGCVISVAKDNSLAFISLEEMSCLYIFGGYPYPIMGIQWRPSEDSLLLSYGDETVHVWQMQSGSLDRILKGSTARMMIGDKQWKISRIASADNIKGNQSKGKTLSSFAIDSTENSTSPLHIFMINIKQLINDIYHYHVSALGSFSFNKTNGVMVETDERGREFDEKDGTQSKIFSWTTTSQIPNAPQSSNSTLYSQLEPESGALGASVVQGLVSALMSWEIDGSLDKICVERLGLKKPINNITFGIRGANGNLSIAAPSCQPGKSIWQISPAMTAIHLLSIVGLTRSFLSMKGLEKYTCDIITHYGNTLPRLVGSGFCHSSLYFLAKYFQDPSVDIQQAARALFSYSLNNMPPEDQQTVIDFWKQFLPAVSSPDSHTNQFMARSTILLAMIAADHPNVLPSKVAKNVALSLTLLLNDESKISHRLAALELCGRGFDIWEPHFNGVAVLRSLFSLAMDGDTNANAVKAMARKAIFQIASNNTTLFISTLTYDTMNSAKPSDKNNYLKLISLFIRKKPLILFSNLPVLVEAVVRSLDPNIPNLRETVLQTTTSILHDLVRTFPSITFHGRSQKLAVGTLEGASIIYDLRTATRWHVLEGHTKPVTAISFSMDGKIIVSCSLDERTVRVWNPSPGLLGMLTGSLAAGTGATREAKPFATTLSSSIKSVRTFGFNLGDEVHLSIPMILDSVHFEWVGERTVKLYVQELTMSFNV